MSWKRILTAIALVVAGALGSQPALVVTGLDTLLIPEVTN